LFQGAAGMYEPESLDKLMQICKENVLTIADEVMTGFGNRKNICDRLFGRKTMMCLSKALTGGTIPMVLRLYTRVI
jgi:adenosylmethionine-8-amino-7-oxononanoate aminotransferase